MPETNHNHTQDLRINTLENALTHHLTEFGEVKLLLKEIQGSLNQLNQKHYVIENMITQEVDRKVNLVEVRLWKVVGLICALVSLAMGAYTFW